MNFIDNTHGKGANVSSARRSGKDRVIDSQVYQSPLYMLIIVASSILIAEVVTISLIHYFLPTLAPWIEDMIDVSLETILIFPVLYFFLFRPLVLHITRRKQAEEVLRESEQKFRTFFDDALDMVHIVDKNGKIVDANKTELETMGYSKEEYLGKSLTEIVHPDYRKVTKKAFEHVLRGREVRDYETALITNKGEKVIVEVSAVPQVEGGKVVAVRAVVRNITERKHAEEERERLNAELARKNKELERMIHVVSHDLRSPLVNIQGFSAELEQAMNNIQSALLSEGVSAEIRNQLLETLEKDIPEALDYILSSASKMQSLIHALLRLSRLGGAALRIEKLDMNRMMADIVKGLEFQAKEVGASVEIEELPSCRGDRGQINQVFSNLLDNALKYLSPDRTGRIKISGKKQRQQCVYCIEDNGIGIPKESCESIYDIFQQVNPSESKGEGLGLTIVRKILDRHRGKAWVESENGKGSKFYVSIPK